MNKMIMLIRNNIHKSRGQMASMLVIILLAGMLMNIGALALHDFSVFFDDKIEELNAPHLTVLFEKSAYSPAYEGFLKSDLLVTKTSTEELLFIQNCSFLYSGGKLTLNTVFQNMDLNREMSPLSLVGAQGEITKNSIFAPYLLQAGGGYAVGDTLTLEFENREYSFQIAGFVEDIMLGGMNTGFIGFYMPDAFYKRFLTESSAIPAILLSAQLTDKRFGEEILNGFAASFRDSRGLLWGISVVMVKYARTIVPNIVSMVIVAFAAIITIIALIVIRFRINDSIRDDIKDMGILKAMGYSARQIKTAIFLQYLGITGAGSIVGILASYLLVPLISKLFSAQTGLIWSQGFAPATSCACLLLILLTVAFSTLFSSKRVKNLNPITAIRGGAEAKGYKKNHFPLHKSSWGLQFLLASKNIMQSPGQNIMIALIIATVTFACAFGLVFFYNMSVDSDSFMETLGGELSSVAVIPISNQNGPRLLEEISVMPGVRKAIFFDDTTAFVGDEACMTTITTDFDDLEGQMLYQGQYPHSADEVAIGGSLSEALGKTIGDTIEIRGWDDKAEYLICGFIQSGNNAGKTLALTIEGAKRILPDYLPWAIYIYLEDGEPADAFIELLENRFGNIIDTPINIDVLLEGQTTSYINIVALMAVIILIITVFIVTLILYFVIKTVIVRRRRDFGLQKALGYTTYQLAQQISLSILPVVVFGAVAGVIGGYFGVGPMLNALFRSVGIMRFDLVIAYHWLAALCVGIALLTYGVALAVSLRIRKISAYALVTE